MSRNERKDSKEEFSCNVNANVKNERKCVKLDLYFDDDEVLQTSNSDENADEVLCLRILSSKAMYRLGALKVHVVSPVVSIGKIFNVEFDEDSEVALIKSQKDDVFGNSEPNIANTSNAATIVISPDRDDLELNKYQIFSNDLTLFESPDSKSEFDHQIGKISKQINASGNENKQNVIVSGGGSRSGSGRRKSQQLKRLTTRGFQNIWHSVIRVKRFFSDSLIWN